MDAEPSALQIISLPDGTTGAVTSIVVDLVLGFLRGPAVAEQGVGIILVQLVGLECRAWTTVFLTDLQIFRCIRYLSQNFTMNSGKQLIMNII